MKLKRPTQVLIVSCVLAALACGGLPTTAPTTTPSDTAAPATPSAASASATAPAATSLPATASAIAPAPASTPLPTESPTTLPPTAVPSPTEPAIETYLAYAQDKNLFVAHIIGGQVLDTRQITEPDPNGWVLSLAWSPSGEYLAFERLKDAFPHAFYFNLLEGGPPVDLGISAGVSWSADSQQLAFGHEYELWVHSVAGGQSRRLTTHLGFNWLWSTPVFAAGDAALLAAGTFADDMAAWSIAPYQFYQVPLDGSAAGSYPPNPKMVSVSPELVGTLPSAIRLSPDGQKLAFATTHYTDGCGSHAEYYVANADGSDLRALPVPSLAALGTAEDEIFTFGDSLAWTPDSAGLWVNGLVTDCARFTGILGAQVTHITLDGAEHEVIPGDFKKVSVDRTGTLLGVVQKTGRTTHVLLLGQDGHLVLDLGEGDQAALQP